jgi:hypothetical protein
MLEVRPCCENCQKALPPNSGEAMICSFECTYCITCVENVLENVCPNCGGNFEHRPIRPKEMLNKYPSSAKYVHKPFDTAQLEHYKKKYQHIQPNIR